MLDGDDTTNMPADTSETMSATRTTKKIFLRDMRGIAKRNDLVLGCSGDRRTNRAYFGCMFMHNQYSKLYTNTEEPLYIDFVVILGNDSDSRIIVMLACPASV